jgi:hypothetical protein
MYLLPVADLRCRGICGTAGAFLRCNGICGTAGALPRCGGNTTAKEPHLRTRIIEIMIK